MSIQTTYLETCVRAAMARMPLRWPRPETTLSAAAPVSFGLAVPRGEVSAACRLRLVAEEGIEIAAQTSVLGHWPDGSVRWLLADAVLPAATKLAGPWEAVIEVSDGGVEPAAGVSVQARGEGFCVTGDEWRGVLDRASGAWRIVEIGGERELATLRLPVLTDERGDVHAATIEAVEVEARGPVRATVVVRGQYPHVRGLRLESRVSFLAAGGLIQVETALHNPQRAQHAGGLWDLGDAGSVLFRDLTLPVAVAKSESSAVWLECEPGESPRHSAGGKVEIYQDSSGGEQWYSENHVNREGVVPCQFRGYRGRVGGEEFAGLRAEPVIEIRSAGVRLAVSVPAFWQQFPKAIDVEDGNLAVRLFPRQCSDRFELQAGEQKTHCVWLRLIPAPPNETHRSGANGKPASNHNEITSAAALREVEAISRQRPFATETAWLPGLPEYGCVDRVVIARLDELLDEFVRGPRGILARREEVDEYGWRNFGELHADHEEQHYRGQKKPLISHYNNQFDVLCGFLLQYLRTGQTQWMELAEPLARHIIDIDIYHTDRDRPAYSGGLFWFTDHYLHAHTSTHRTFSRHNRPAGASYGGGPGAEHNFTTGLTLFHLLTGLPQARAAALSLADWVLAMDDGARTFLGVVDDGPTGLASLTGSPLYHGPGRGSGNSINALLDGWLLTHDRKYLSYAETLIRRCIHPQTDLAGLELLNAEKRWSYPLFLVSLSKYLVCKAEADEIDDAYSYAQASLVHVGRWMLDNERPYFDRIEELEYPTEAWPAQELRKANALRLAAHHAEDPWRTRMLDRGDELAERAWADLMVFHTRTTARAMAVVMVEGLRDAWLRRRKFEALPRAAATGSFAPPAPFVPQRERVKRKLKSPLGIASLLAAGANPRRWPRLLNPR